MILTLGAYAKVNLSLHVTGRRPDGYHDIVSVMQGVDLHDDVTVGVTGDLREDLPEAEGCRCVSLPVEGYRVLLSSDSDAMPYDATNLAVRGAKALLRQQAFRDRMPRGDGTAVRIHIAKRLPVAAGIAGGSGNAAAVMLALDALLGYPYSLRELMDTGAGVGADVPFSLMMNAYRNRTGLSQMPGIGEASPAALMKGIGDVVLPQEPLEYAVILMNPGTRVSTALAYREIDSLPARTDGRYELFYNVFEEYVYHADPEAARLREAMERHLHADHILLSGSGPTIVAYYINKETALRDYEDTTTTGWADSNWRIWYSHCAGKQGE